MPSSAWKKRKGTRLSKEFAIPKPSLSRTRTICTTHLQKGFWHRVVAAWRVHPAMTRQLFFFFNDTATTEIYTLSLHDALPIFQFPLTTDYSAAGLFLNAVDFN